MNMLFSARPAHLPKRGYYVALVATLLAVALVFGAFSFTPAAHASSSNAREIAVASTSLNLVQSFWVDGKNQNNKQVGYCLNYYLGIDNGYVLIPNWWWQGTIRIVEYSNPDCNYPKDYICQGNHNVPTNKGNPVDINADAGCYA